MKQTDDIDRGGWLRQRITDQGGYAAHAGTGWQAYARILHPVEAFGEADGEFVAFEWTWAEAARRRGVGMHPLVDWSTIGRQSGQVQVDGLTLSPGREGALEPQLLGHLASVLETATATPDDVTIGVWTGFGGHDDSRSAAATIPSRLGDQTQVSPASTAAGLAALMQRMQVEAHARLQASNFQPRPYGAILELPHREYHLATTTLRDLGDEAELDPDLANGVQLIWPADHAWLVASEIDFDSTIVGGSAALIRRITEHPDLEAYAVLEDDRFDVDARTALCR